MKRTYAFLLSTLWVICTCNAQFRVQDLRVEHLQNPPVIETLQPRFSWINETIRPLDRAQTQTAYRIGVASSQEQLDREVFDVWDSGKQASDSSHLVNYRGPALESGKVYFWKVRTWDRKGKASAWSPSAHWGMGIKQEEWNARWISSAQDDFGAPLLRKTFRIDKPVRHARIFVCGLGFFELQVNGQRIGEDYLVPNITNYAPRYDLDKYGISIDNRFTDYRVLYLAYDVTTQLGAGENALGVILGNGWYRSDTGRASVFGKPTLRLQMDITYQDGSKDQLCSDGTWKTHPSPIIYNGIYQGEFYDANAEVAGWSRPALDETGWQPAQVVAGPDSKMTAMSSPADRITERLKPTSLKKTGEKTWEVSFSHEIAGWLYCQQLEGNKGDTLHIDYVCESPQGTQRYIFRGEGKESYRPHFTWFVFSKAIVRGIENLTSENLTAEAVNTDVPVSATFHTSNPLFNRINEIWQQSQLDNMHGCVASDCPHRERLPYTGDGQAAMETVLLNFDAAAFYQKWIRDLRDAQNRETGYVPNSAPWQPTAGGGVPWGAAMNVMPWQYYVQYGDTRLLSESYGAMKKQLQHMLRWLTPDGVMYQQMRNHGRDDICYWLNLGDWCPPGEMVPDAVVHTFYLWLCADYTARAARALQQTDEATQYQQLADQVRDNFHRHFFNATTGHYGDFGADIYALRMGVPEAYRQGVIKALQDDITIKHQGHITTGFIGTKFFFETLSDHGLHQLAYDAMNKRDFPSYGWWIEQGATVTWEQWDGGNSHNHPMFGGGLTWFYRKLAGVEADEEKPGYRHFLIRPYLSDLEEVSYSQRTPYGRVASRILQRDGQVQYHINVPVGCTATLQIPTAGEITESGKVLTRAKGITSVRQEADTTTIQLQQGNYLFIRQQKQ